MLRHSEIRLKGEGSQADSCDFGKLREQQDGYSKSVSGVLWYIIAPNSSTPCERITHTHFLPCDLAVPLIGSVYFSDPLIFPLAMRLVLNNSMRPDVACAMFQQRL